jgi:hypothetical protein
LLERSGEQQQQIERLQAERMLMRTIDDYKQVIADGVKHISSHHDPERFAERWFKDEVFDEQGFERCVGMTHWEASVPRVTSGNAPARKSQTK